MDIVTRLAASGPVPVEPITPIPAGTPLLPIGLFQAPAVYAYNGAAWDMTAAGLYVIVSVGAADTENAQYVIAFDSGADPTELMRGLAFVTQYGRRDEGLTPDENHATGALWTARARKVALRCGPTEALVAYACRKFGIPHRTVELLTAAPPNGFDDGHVVSEIQIAGRWVLFDIASKATFTDDSGTQLSLAALVAGDVGTAMTQEITVPDSYPEDWSNSQFATGCYYAQVWQTPALRAAWRRRIYQIPGIVQPDGTTLWCLPPGTESRRPWLQSLSAAYQVTDRATWLATFYPPEE